MRINGLAQSQRLHQIAWHRYEWDIKPQRAEKSVGTETTFETDVRDRDELRRSILALADRTAARARRAGLLGKGVALEARTNEIKNLTGYSNSAITIDQ